MTAQPDLFTGDPEPRPLAGCVTEGWHAWRRMQTTFARAEERATAAHRPRRHLREQKRALVHAALRGGA